MKTIIQLPRDVEVKSIVINNEAGTIEIEHLFLRRQSQVAVLYLIGKGDGGMETRSVLTVDGNRGKYGVTAIADAPSPVFDLSPGEFNQKQADRSRGKKGLPRNATA